MHNRPATTRQSSSRTAACRLLLKRVWLPAPLYALMPFLYLLLGAMALASGIYLPDPGWILGYLLLISAGCVHACIWILMLRRRYRCSRLRRLRTRRTPAIPTRRSATGL